MNSLEKAIPNDRLDRIARRMERLETTESEWARDPVEFETPFPDVRLETVSGETTQPHSLRWDSNRFLVRLNSGGNRFERFISAMVQQAKKRPFSIRTQQLAALLSFLPFVLAILVASVRFMPKLPTMDFWSKLTWFLMLPVFLAITGALIGFIIGVMLDTVERDSGEESAESSPGDEGEIPPPSGEPAASGVRSAAWISLADLRANQRVAETVLAPDGTPILLKHTLLKPTHLELLEERGVDRVKIEVMTYPSEADLAMAG